MKILKASSLAFEQDGKISAISDSLDKLEKNEIGIVPWAEFPYKPKVSFAIAYSDDSILLKYYVKEKAISAIHQQPNSHVYKDTCVEFFISFNNEVNYYNLEFNCTGTCRAGFGDNRDNRELLSPALINKIKHLSNIKSGNSATDQDVSWELTLQIPLAVFYRHNIKELKGLHCRANFYKCGDDLPDPHFLCWNPIDSAEPNFHLPAFFGEVHFI